MYSLPPTNIAGVFVSEAVEVVDDVDFIEAMFLLMKSIIFGHWLVKLAACRITNSQVIHEAHENFLLQHII